MTYILILALVVLMGLVVYSLVRGIAAFLQTTREELDSDPDSGPTRSQLKQNKMMFNRIMYQGLAVLVVAILLAWSGS